MDRPDYFLYVTRSYVDRVGQTLASTHIGDFDRQMGMYLMAFARQGVEPGPRMPDPLVFLGKAVVEIRGVKPELPERPTSRVFARFGIRFIASLLRELRELICGKGKKSSKPLGATAQSIISALGAAIARMLHVENPTAVGLGTLVLLSLSRAAKRAFCRMTDGDVLKALREA